VGGKVVEDGLLRILELHKERDSMRTTRGVVSAINHRRGMVAIWVEQRGGHTIIEMQSSDEISVGDHITWDTDTSMGDNPYRNETKGWVAEVYVQNHDVSQSSLQAQLLM
jgi:hypothetical protein